jgi:hypothetical protein
MVGRNPFQRKGYRRKHRLAGQFGENGRRDEHLTEKAGEQIGFLDEYEVIQRGGRRQRAARMNPTPSMNQITAV